MRGWGGGQDPHLKSECGAHVCSWFRSGIPLTCPKTVEILSVAAGNGTG
jgi:hypothetical protein